MMVCVRILRYKGDTESKFFLTFADDMYHEMRKWFEQKNEGEPLVRKNASSRKLKTQQKMIQHHRTEFETTQHCRI